MKQYRTLVLNLDFSPLMVRSWQKAITLIFKGVADEVDSYDEKIRDYKNNYYRIPSIIRLHKYVRQRRKSLAVSKRKLIIRDSSKCAYCGRKFGPGELTIDHIVPRSKWKDKEPVHNWKNIVAACFKCNGKKADRTPEEARMPLLIKPTIPTHMSLGLLSVETVPEAWQLYLPKREKM